MINNRFKICICLAMLLSFHYVKGQLKPGAWYAEGEYNSKSPIGDQMKQMGAEKKLVLNIGESGNISGKLVTSYNRTNAAKPQEGFDQSYTLIGKIEAAENVLLLILTHLKTHPNEPESFLTFAKPDSLYYDLVSPPVNRHNKTFIEAIARNPITNLQLEECVGSPFYGGLGYGSADHRNAHLLPLKISFEIDKKKTGINRMKPADKITKQEVTEPVPQPPVTPVGTSTRPPVPRKTKVQKTITLESPEISIAFYDNGEIDGDIATLILDGKTLIDKHLLTAKPAMITFTLSDQTEEHILEMYADNLGSIPPNTALVVLTCNQKRYEINLSSTEQINEAVKLVVANPKKKS